LETLNLAARQMRDGLKKLGIKAEQLKALVLRSNLAGELLGSLYVFSEEIEVNKVIEVVEGIKEIKGFKVAFSTPLSPTNTPTKVLAAYGAESIEEKVLGKKLKFSDTSFFQANIPIFEQAVKDIKEHVNAKDKLYDIYCGVGTIGIVLGVPGIKMIETEPESVKYARLNCQLNGWEANTVIASKAEDWLGEIETGATVIFDPPRPGFHPKVFKALVAKPPQRIIYLSCNPVAQARDIKELGDTYKLVFFKAYNFFPRTPHIETLAVLDKK
jgi:23S rRNA (uracil1939-C5)-methyltransferase